MARPSYRKQKQRPPSETIDREPTRLEDGPFEKANSPGIRTIGADYPRMGKTGRISALGGMAERLNAPVLKTGDGLVPFVGSNPTPSVKRLCDNWLRHAKNRRSANRFRVYVPFVRFAAIARVRVLRSLLRLSCAAFRATYRTVEVIVGCLGIVLQTHLGVVSHPLCDYVNRELFQQFSFA
jgi:hypothetical protein